MELPELGKNCHHSACKQLDFLPMKCDGCSQVFCKDHYSYDNHSCPEAYRKNFQVGLEFIFIPFLTEKIEDEIKRLYWIIQGDEG